MTRAFFCEASDPQWFEAATTLRDEHGWSLVGWSGTGDDPAAFARRVAREIAGALHHDTYESVRGLVPPGWRRRDLPDVDVGDIEELEWEAVRMMDRLQLVRGSFPDDERRALFGRLVRYWSAALDELAIDVLVHPTAPHLVYDFVLHELARRRGIRTILFERTWSPSRVLVVDDMRAGPSELPRRYRELLAAGAAPVLEPETAAELERLRRPYSHAVSDIHRYKLTTTSSPTGSRLGRKMAGAGRLLGHPAAVMTYLRPDHRSYGKVPNRPIDTAWPTAWHIRAADRTADRDKRALRAAYDDLAAPVSGDFAYLPLHFQPERTTSPLGGRFVDPRIMVSTVAAALPDGWRLAVREHPLTLRRNTRGHLARDDRLYADLAATPGVVLAPLDADPFDLLDRSRAVVTVTGSTGWEALVRGKHVLVLGPAWYAGCEGAHRVRSTDDARAAFATVDEPVETRRVELFAQAADDVAHHAFAASILAGITGGSDEGSGRVLASAIASAAGGGSPCSP